MNLLPVYLLILFTFQIQAKPCNSIPQVLKILEIGPNAYDAMKLQKSIPQKYKNLVVSRASESPQPPSKAPVYKPQKSIFDLGLSKEAKASLRAELRTDPYFINLINSVDKSEQDLILEVINKMRKKNMDNNKIRKNIEQLMNSCSL